MHGNAASMLFMYAGFCQQKATESLLRTDFCPQAVPCFAVFLPEPAGIGRKKQALQLFRCKISCPPFVE